MADYAELQERLRATTKEMAARASVDMALWDKHSNACIKAADAIAALRRECDQWRRNSRETYEAMVSMRNDINEVIPLPSIESDLARGPCNDVFCAEVAQGVVTAFAALEAENARMREAINQQIGGHELLLLAVDANDPARRCAG